MRPDPRFLGKPKSFWANVRTISQALGYTERRAGRIRVPDFAAMRKAYGELALSDAVLFDKGAPNEFATELHAYFQHRATVLNDFVEPRLMDGARAEAEFEALKVELKPVRPISMNNQKGTVKAEAFLTGMVNMLIEAHCEGLPCDYDPRTDHCHKGWHPHPHLGSPG